VGIHQDDGAALLAEAVVGETLQLVVDGEHELVAGVALLAVELADDAAEGVDLDLARAGFAA